MVQRQDKGSIRNSGYGRIMMQQKYTGFLSYLETKTFTPEFINDYNYWCKKIFNQWSLFTDLENFTGRCWEALLSKINEFDPSIATIQTFCISRINNEAWRIYMKNKQRKPEVDSDDPVYQSDLSFISNYEQTDEIQSFIQYANKRGVQVDEDELIADLTDNKITPTKIVWAWWKEHNL